MSTARLHLGLVCLMLGAAGCAEHDIIVGDAIATFDFDQCYGQHTDCDQTDLTRDVVELGSEPVTCTPAADRAPRELVWERRIEGAIGQIALSGDGSLWTAGHGTDAAQGTLFVDRFNRAGEHLFHTALHLVDGHDFGRAYGKALVIDARGHGLLLVHTTVADEARGWKMFERYVIVELEPGGEQVGEPLALDDALAVQALAVDASGALTVSAAASAGAPVLARLDVDRSLRWVQNRTTQRDAPQLRVDDSGGVYVLGSSLSDPQGTALIESLVRYDADGNALWELETGMVMSALSLTEDGGALLFGQREGPMLQNSVVKLDARGNTLWSHVFDVDPQAHWLDHEERALGSNAEGHTYFIASTVGGGQLSLNRVSSDGRACEETAVVTVRGRRLFRVTPDGALYEVADYNKAEADVGLYER